MEKKSWFQRALMTIIPVILFMLVAAVSAFAEQNALWFMDDMNFTQLPGGDYSHSGTLNFDVVGTRNHNIKAPFDCTIVQIFTGYDAGNTVIIQSNAPVRYANGTVDYMSMAFAHDNDISDCYVGRVIGQGQVFLQNGNYGNVTGVHSHVTVISGRYTDHPGWVQVSTGNWTFNNGMHPVDALFISDSTNIVNTMGLTFKKATNSVVLDVNGLLDGVLGGNLGNYGTCDVYIRGTRVADDKNDYAAELPVGTSYEIKDIKARDGYKYEGVDSGSLSGTLGTSRVNVVLKFTSYATLEVKGLLDDVASDSISGFGTFDVYINGSLDEPGVSDYNKKWPQGTSYELRNIQANNGKYYERPASGAVKGTLGKGTTSVRLSFLTKLVPTTQWQETTSLPSYLDLSNCEVEYNNHYKKTATSSPGSGWVQVPGSGVTTYVNSGGVQESDFPLETSNTRVLVGTYYYHYCAQGAGEVEHYNDGYHTVYHNVGDINQFYTDWEGADSSDSRYTAYRIKWVSGQWANGYAYCELGSPAVYYRRYQYQNRTAVINYIWTRDSGWTTSKDSSANSVTYRFRLMSGRTLILPASLKFIGEQAFAGIDASVITIPDGCTTIGSQAFLNCKNLTRLNIPASVTSIAYDAFNGCDNLVIYAPQGSTAISLASSLGIKYQVTQ